jgi:hypothetical protein
MDPVLMKEALTNAVELNSPLTNDAKKGEGEVTLAFKSLEKWAMGDASKDNGVDGVENSATGDSPKQKATKDGSTNESRGKSLVYSILKDI